MSEPVTLSEIEARLRNAKMRPPRAGGVSAPKRGRPRSKRAQAAQMIADLAATALGRDWDGPVPWEPIRDRVLAAGYSEDTIRRGMRSAGIGLWPRRGGTAPPGGRRVFPPGLEIPADDQPPPAPVAVEREPSVRDEVVEIEAEHVEAVEAGIEALAEALAEAPPVVAAGVCDAAAQVHAPAYQESRFRVQLSKITGIRPTTRETLAGHKVGTVGQALEHDEWLDELVGQQQAERIRQYARGL